MSPRKPLSNAQGMSLIEVMISLGIACFVIAGLATLYTNMKETVAANEAMREADQLRNYIQGLLNQPSICSGALRSGAGVGGSPITWFPGGGATGQAAVGHIEVNQVSSPVTAGLGARVALAAGANYSNLLQIRNIWLREPVVSEGPAARSTLVRNGVTYQTHVAKLQIDAFTRSLSRGVFIKKTVDLVVARDPGGVVRFCVQQEDVLKPLNQTCNAGTLFPGNPPCIADIYCRPVYYFSGFDRSGKPKCTCQTSCIDGPKGETGYY